MKGGQKILWCNVPLLVFHRLERISNNSTFSLRILLEGTGGSSISRWTPFLLVSNRWLLFSVCVSSLSATAYIPVQAKIRFSLACNAPDESEFHPDSCISGFRKVGCKVQTAFGATVVDCFVGNVKSCFSYHPLLHHDCRTICECWDHT